jgi:osmotically-inducible protein OsmY
MRIPHPDLFSVFAVLVLGAPLHAQTSSSMSLANSDSSVSALNKAFATDPTLHDVRVEMVDGYVHIRGTVDVLEDSRVAMNRAQQSISSNGLISHIVVRTPYVPDRDLRRQLAGKLNGLQIDSVRLRVRRGVVRVSGTISEENQRETVLSTIRSTPGVTGVDDLITVNRR